jgi:hypothetical protein
VSGNGSVEEGNVDRGLERRGSRSKAFLSREIMDRSQVGLELARLAVIWLQLGPGLQGGKLRVLLPVPSVRRQAVSAGELGPQFVDVSRTAPTPETVDPQSDQLIKAGWNLPSPLHPPRCQRLHVTLLLLELELDCVFGAETAKSFEKAWLDPEKQPADRHSLTCVRMVSTTVSKSYA